MHLTKYEHACFVFEKDDASVVVDPGVLTTDLVIPENVAAIVITHEHADHFDKGLVASIQAKNPAAVVVGPGAVTSQVNGETRTVKGGDNFTVQGIELEFFGDTHEPIHRTRPAVQNVGVLIEERVYYPGDSFTVPEKSVDVLAVPVGGPWLKVGETIDFMLAVAPRFAFPTHDAVLSRDGQGFSDANVASFADAEDIEFTRIDGETIEIE